MSGTTTPAGHAPGGRLVLAGNVVADLVIEVPALPERGGDVIGTGAVLTAGGGFNCLVAARRLGTEAVFAGAHGTGPYGDLVRRALAAEGVRALLPARTDGDTGFTVALVDAGGERTFVTSFGVEADLLPEQAQAAAREVRAPDVVQVSGYGLVLERSGPLWSAFVGGLPAGVTVCLDPGPLAGDIPPAVLDPVLARTDWLSANAREARLLSGLAEPAAAAEALRERLAPAAGVIVRVDRDGCLLAPPGGGAAVRVPGYPVHAVDSNGAGDAHVGAFLALTARGFAAPEAVRAANAAAAYAVTRRGPATAPDRAQLTEFLVRVGDEETAALVASAG